MSQLGLVEKVVADAAPTCCRIPGWYVMAAVHDEETWRPEEDQIIKLVVVTEGPK